MKCRPLMILFVISLFAGACGAPAAPTPTAPAESLPPTVHPTATATTGAAFSSPTPGLAASPSAGAPPEPASQESPTSEPDRAATSSPSEDLVFQMPDGTEVHATFSPGDGDPPWPGVMLLHMYSYRRTDWTDFAARLAGQGYASLAVDLRGHGDTGGEYNWPASREDLLHIWGAWIDRPDIDARRSAVIGASIGANLALLTGADQPEIETVVALSPGLDYFGVETGDSLEAYGARPVLLVAAEQDAYAAESARRLYLSAPDGSRLELYQGSGHGTDLFRQEDALADLLHGWLDRHLKDETGALPLPVRFQTADDLSLSGLLYGEGKTVVILSNMSDSPQSIWNPLVSRLVERGYSVLTYDYRGRGASEGRPDFAASEADLQAAVEFARGRGAESIALVGASLGGMAAANVAPTGDFAAVTVLSSPAATNGYRVTEETLAAIRAPKLFLNSEGDRFIEDTRQMFAAAQQPKEIEIYPGDAHGTELFDTQAGPDVLDRLLAFLTSHLPPK